MTLVKIDIKNIASETHPDDRVVFYSPTDREAPGGGITSTAETVVPLVDGIGEKDLNPGPVTVMLECRGIADTRPKSGTVPDEGPVGLGDVVAGDFVYTPAVVSAAVQARNDSQAAADRAEAAADRAEAGADRAEAGADRVGTAEQVGTWASQAASSASTASSAATSATAAKNEAATSATAAASSATTASQAATNAGSSASAAGSSASQAASSASTASSAATSATAAASVATTAKNAAASSATDAAGSATTATNKAIEASNSADRAEAATAGKADLIGGKVPTSQIPEVALTKPSQVVSRAEMLALNAQEGDIAIITTGADKGTYILGPGASNVFTSWVPMAVSADVPVQSVNGQVGNVNLGASDVGASPTNHTHKPESIGAAPVVHTHDPYDINGWRPYSSHVSHVGSVPWRTTGGHIMLPPGAPPAGAATSREYVDQRPALFSGVGLPPASIAGATVGDYWLNETTMELSKITGV